MTNDSKLVTAAAELGRDQILPDPTDSQIVMAVEEMVDIRLDHSEWIADRQRRGIISAWERGRRLNDPEADVAPIVRSVISTFGLS